MKIGILTFFNVPNYGAMLQAYALWHFLEKRGHQVEFIRYDFGNTWRPRFWKCFYSRHFSSLQRKLRFWAQFPMARFSDDYPQTQLFSSLEELRAGCGDFDAVVVGSDQMWNPNGVARGANPVVFLDFLPPHTKRISYAASFACPEWGEDAKEEVGALLRKFTAISVRERSGVSIVADVSGMSAQCLPDPTLLFPARFYDRIASKRNDSGEKYIFSYFLDEWQDGSVEQSFLGKCRDSLGIDRVVTARKKMRGLGGFLLSSFGVSGRIPVPRWVASIRDASFVVTNSFHGTVFALIFHKPFATVLLSGKMAGMNERIVSLLQSVGLEDRMLAFDESETIDLISSRKIDWEKVDSRFEKNGKMVDDFFISCGL